MTRLILTTLLAGLALTVQPHQAAAGPNTPALICLHVRPVGAPRTACAASMPTYYNVITHGGLLPNAYFVYLLVVNGNAAAGVGGLQCGITYDNAPGSGVDIYSWSLCATLDFQSTGWPASGGGSLITWDVASNCQRTEPGGPLTGVTAAAGYFYCAAYTPDVLRVIPRPLDGFAKLADCGANVDDITPFPPGSSGHLGSAAFTAAGVSGGLCISELPVKPTTWSAIKAHLED